MRVSVAAALVLCIIHAHTLGVDARRRLSATAMVTATTSPASLDLGYISGNLTDLSAPANATAASMAIVDVARMNTTSTVQTIATGFAAVLINGTHGNATGDALSMALSNTTNSTQQNVAQGYATAILAFYAANYTKVSTCSIQQSAPADALAFVLPVSRCFAPLCAGGCDSDRILAGCWPDRRGGSCKLCCL